MPPEIPARIGPYDVMGVIGSGRLGTVYRAFHEAESRVVIIRVLSPELLADAPRLDLFRRDSQALAALGHPNLARTFDGGQEGDLVYTVTEYVDGCSLHNRLESSRLTLAEAIQVVREIANGLAAAHSMRIVHGDLNPRNVLVSRDLSVVKVTDFGSADPVVTTASVGTVKLDRERVGSMPYRAPEVSSGQHAADVRSDVYSLGVVAYQSLTGSLPVGRFSLPSDVDPQVPLQLDPIVLRCLASDPAQRYQSVAAFLADLNKVEEVVDYQLLSELKRLSGGRLFTTRVAPRRSKSRSSRTPLYWGAALIVLIAAAATAALLLRGSGRLAGGETDDQRGAVAPTSKPEPDAAITPGGSEGGGQPGPQPPLAARALGSTGATAVAPTPTAPTPPAGPAEAPVAPTSSPASSAAVPAPERTRSATTVVPRPVAPRSDDAPEAKPSAPEISPKAPAKAPPAPDPEALAEALFNQALSLRRNGDDVGARARLASIGRSYAETSWFVPAMTVKIAIEDRDHLQEFDPVVGAVVPASIPTRRLLTERAPRHPSAEATLWELGKTYEDLERYSMAVRAYVQLARTFPRTRFDAWFRAGEITERRLRDTERARQAYLNVPGTSPRYQDAQKRARRLAER